MSIGPIIDAVEGALQNPSSAGGGNEGQAVFNTTLIGVITDFLKGVLFVFGQVQGAWKWCQSRAKQIGKDFETIQGANQSAMQHVVDNVLPNSLAFLSGQLYAQAINPLRKTVKGIQANLVKVFKWEDAIDLWKQKTVTPWITRTEKFIDYFTQHYVKPLDTLITWLSQPGTLARFIAGPIIAPLVGQLGADEHKVGRDALTTLMVRAWSEEVNPVWEAILQWVVSDK